MKFWLPAGRRARSLAALWIRLISNVLAQYSTAGAGLLGYEMQSVDYGFGNKGPYGCRCLNFEEMKSLVAIAKLTACSPSTCAVGAS